MYESLWLLSLYTDFNVNAHERRWMDMLLCCCVVLDDEIKTKLKKYVIITGNAINANFYKN